MYGAAHTSKGLKPTTWSTDHLVRRVVGVLVADLIGQHVSVQVSPSVSATPGSSVNVVGPPLKVLTNATTHGAHQREPRRRHVDRLAECHREVGVDREVGSAVVSGKVPIAPPVQNRSHGDRRKIYHCQPVIGARTYIKFIPTDPERGAIGNAQTRNRKAHGGLVPGCIAILLPPRSYLRLALLRSRPS